MWQQNILQLNAISVQRFTGILRRSEKYCSTYLKLSNINLLLEESSIISCFNVSIASTLLMYRIVQNDKYNNSFLWFNIFGMTKAQQVSVHTRKQELLVLLLTTCMPFRAVWKAILSVCTNHKCQWRVSEITKETRSHYSTFNSFCFTDCITVLFPIEKNKSHWF